MAHGGYVTIYAFSQTGCEKVAPAGQFETVTCPSMTDGLSTLYQDLLGGSYDCVDRIVLNAYFRMGHPPFPAQVMLNGHEYVACQARKAGIVFTKEGNCFTTISDAAGLAKIADTLSEPRAIGRLSQVCERWIYSCVCFALDFDEQKRSGFRYQYSNYQIEYSRNLVFQVGGHMDQVFQALIDRSRAPLDLKTIRTILGYRHRPIYRRRTKRSAEWEVAVERPKYDLTIFKLHCGKLT